MASYGFEYISFRRDSLTVLISLSFDSESLGIYVNQHNLGTFKKISTISFLTNIARGTGDKDDQPLYLTLANTIADPLFQRCFQVFSLWQRFCYGQDTTSPERKSQSNQLPTRLMPFKPSLHRENRP